MSWIFSILVLYATYLIGKKNKWGWIVSTIAAIGFITVYIETSIYGGIALDVVLIVLNIRNFIKWHKNDKQLSTSSPPSPIRQSR